MLGLTLSTEKPKKQATVEPEAAEELPQVDESTVESLSDQVGVMLCHNVPGANSA